MATKFQEVVAAAHAAKKNEGKDKGKGKRTSFTEGGRAAHDTPTTRDLLKYDVRRGSVAPTSMTVAAEANKQRLAAQAIASE